MIITNAGGNPKYKVGDIVEADELVEDGRPRRKGVEFEPYSFYLSAWEEDQYIIAQANAAVDDDGRFKQERVNAAKPATSSCRRATRCSSSTSRRSSSSRWPPR